MKVSKAKAMKLVKATTLSVAACMSGLPAHSQSDVSLVSAVSGLPVGSVVVGSEASRATAEASLLMSAMGARLMVKGVQSTARGTVYVLERVADKVRVSIEVAGHVVGISAMGVGTLVTVGVIAAGTVLSVGGAAIAFVPNQIGKTLLHNKRISQ